MYFSLVDAEATSTVPQSVTSATSSIATTTSSTTSMLPSTTTSSSGCSTSSRCQLASQPTCGGCLSYQPCTTDGNVLNENSVFHIGLHLLGTQPCTAYNYQISLTGCDQIVNGVAQCRYQ